MIQFTLENIKRLEKVIGIYKITCNEKVYIGSSTSIGHRLKHHLWALKTFNHHNRTIQNLFNKYSIDTFKIDVLEECNADDLIEKEKYYIDTLNPYMNHILNPQKIERDVVYRKRLSEGLKKAYNNGLRPHNDKPVHQYLISGEYLKSFNTATEASLNLLKSDPSAICTCCRNESYTAYGYRWSYLKQDFLPQISNKNYVRKKIYQLDLEGNLIKEWDSIIDVKNQLGICNISRAISKNLTAGNYRWKYKT
jgi:group I intron endonuclease